MEYVILTAALLTLAGSGYYWYQDKDDSESVRIYRTIFIISLIIAVFSGISIVPEDFMEAHAKWFHVIADTVMACGIAGMLIKVFRQKKPGKKAAVVFSAVVLAMALSLTVFSFYRHITADQPSSEGMQEATNRAGAALQYAEQRLVQEHGIARDSVNGRFYGFVTADPVYYIVGFTYTVPGTDTEKSYGYHISVDDNYHFEILEQNEEIGKQMISTEESK